MASPSLNAVPAPAQPADVVENPNLANYYNALDAVYEILKQEHDPLRRMKAEECRTFLESAISAYESPDMTTIAPAPSPMPPMPPMGAQQPGQPGPQLTGGGLPGAPQAPPPVPAMTGLPTPGGMPQ